LCLRNCFVCSIDFGNFEKVTNPERRLAMHEASRQTKSKDLLLAATTTPAAGSPPTSLGFAQTGKGTSSTRTNPPAKIRGFQPLRLAFANPPAHPSRCDPNHNLP
jgi:hypothetical protein